MRPSPIERAADAGAAAPLGRDAGAAATRRAPAQFLAGGTTLLDLMKLDVMRPERAGRHQRAARRATATSRPDATGLRLGALARMADAADHPAVRARLSGDRPVACSWRPARSCATWRPRRQRPAAHPLQLFPRRRAGAPATSASPARGCAAWTASTATTRCSASASTASPTIPATSRMALVALDAERRARGRRRARARIAVRRAAPPARRHAAHRDHLQPGELITGFRVPAGPWTRRSLYLKVRDRAVLRVRARLGGGGARPRRRRRCARRASALGGVADQALARARGRGGAARASRSTKRRRRDAAEAALRRRRHARRQRLQARARPPHPGARAAARPRRWRSDDGRRSPDGLVSASRAPRIDGRAKVTGAARYASDEPVAEPGLRVPGHQRDRAGRIARLRPRRRRAPCRACSTSSPTRTSATQVKPPPRPPSGGRRPRPRGDRPHLARRPDHRASSSPTPSRPRARPPTRSRRLRRRSRRSATFDSPGVDDGAARAAARHEDPEVGDAEAAFAARAGEDRRALRDADPAPQSDRALHHHLRLGRRPS